ncbi:MAG: hypothetical protein ABIY56_01575 [Dokdonella sp.]
MRRYLLAFALSAAAGQAGAVDGLPDSTFGLFSSGRNSIALNNGGTNSDSTVDVLVNADRSVFMVGTSRGAGAISRFSITKLTANGTIDLSFGVNGSVYSTLTTVKASRARLDSAGNVIIVGTRQNAGTDSDFYVCRFNPQGQPFVFTSIGTNCKSIPIDVQGGNNTDEARDFVVDSWGAITIAGNAGVTATVSRIAFARLTPTGAMDVTFGGGSGKITHEPLPGKINRVNALARKRNGKYYAVGEAGNPASENGTDALFTVLTASGYMDMGFQDGLGFTLFSVNQGAAFHRNDVAKSVEVLSNGSVLLAGTTDTGTGATQRRGFLFKIDEVVDFVYMDTAFGVDGRVYYSGGSYIVDFNRLLVQSDDRIVVVGSRQATLASDSLMHVLRFQANGLTDASDFGAIGRVDVDFMLPGGDDYGTAVASQSGSLLIAGSSKSQDSQDLDMTVTRLHNDLIFADGME